MTDENQVEDNEIDLHDEVEDEVVEEAHDPKNAEAQSVASVDKAEKAAGTAKKRRGDKGNKDPMQKLPGTKAGMMNAAYNMMAGMNKEDLKVALGKLVAEQTEEGEVVEAPAELDYQTDFSADLNAVSYTHLTLPTTPYV